MSGKGKQVVVLGAGVIGVASAYYLAKAGHQVTVIERREGPGLETSYANAGELTPGYAAPWAAPGVPLKAVKWMFTKHAPLIIPLLPNLPALRWMGQMAMNCNADRFRINRERMVRLAEYSRQCLISLRADIGVSYDEGTNGTLQLFRSRKQMEGVVKAVDLLRREGTPFEILDAAGCVGVEPGLAPRVDEIVGGLRLPNDETGDCYLFTSRLKDLAVELGVDFRFGVEVWNLRAEGARIVAVDTDDGLFAAETFVIALGSRSPRVVKPLGLRLPVYPLKGYSMTMPIRNAERAPLSTVLDETYKIAITRLGERIRVGGMAEIAGFDTGISKAREETLRISVESLFEGAGDLGKVVYWSGLRPMTPDGPPVVGATAYGNLFLNTGHGTFGWTMACGSAQLLADLIGGRDTAIASHGLSLDRYAR